MQTKHAKFFGYAIDARKTLAKSNLHRDTEHNHIFIIANKNV